MFFNYKKFFSVVIQGLVDANYKFITVDMGGRGFRGTKRPRHVFGLRLVQFYRRKKNKFSKT